MSDSTIRLLIFFSILVVLGLVELYLPRREFGRYKLRRWITNLTMVGVDGITLRLVFPILAVGVAEYMDSQGYGLFGLLDWPLWLELVLAVILLDLAIYIQHVATHKIPVLWLLHQVHHADTEVDVTTGTRFHPFEIVLSMLYKFAVIALIGPSAFAVFLFEILLNVFAMFSHANIKLSADVDNRLRTLIVTPDMHRIHHSTLMKETDSNYGFNLSIWDRLFGTDIETPKAGHAAMLIGLTPYQSRKPSTLIWCLLLPFKQVKRVLGFRK
jgi:sterol desaturase/sphingolipid hydroxylase (fatty acid hydroxylase superfamily)